MDIHKVLKRKIKKYEGLNFVTNEADNEQFWIIRFKDNFIKINPDDAEKLFKDMQSQSAEIHFKNSVMSLANSSN